MAVFCLSYTPFLVCAFPAGQVVVAWLVPWGADFLKKWGWSLDKINKKMTLIERNTFSVAVGIKC